MDQNTTTTTPQTTLDQALRLGSLGYKIVPLPPGEKFPKGLSAWQDRATNDSDQITDWWGSGEAGIGWAMGLQPNGRFLVAVDVDVVDGKGGAATFKAVAARFGLGPSIRDTVVSITGSGGRHVIFEVPKEAGVTNGKLGDGLDLRGEGGFVVVPPSVHPNGESYRWVPGKAPWDVDPVRIEGPFVEFLSDPRGADVRAASSLPVGRPGGGTDDSPADWVRANFRIGDMLSQAGWTYMHSRGGDHFWCRPGKEPRDGHSAILHDDAPLVVWSTSCPSSFWRAGSDARDGARVLSPLEVFAAINHSGDVAAASSHVRRQLMPTRDEAPAMSSGAPSSSVQWGAGPGERNPTSMNLPDEFWESRALLSHIRQAAHARMVSPDATLIGVLARFAAIVPAQYRIPPIVGSEATLDLIGCSVASSSGGKTVANHVAADLLPVDRRDILMDLPVGSGEGLIQSFLVDELDDDGRKTGRQIVGMSAIHFTVDEGTALMEQQARRGTTIVQTLCSAWSGATLGQANASAETRRIIEARRVRVSAVINIQTANGHLLLDERMIAVGLPQRIVFASAHAPLPDLDSLPTWPGPLSVRHPPIIGNSPVYLEYAPEIVQELRERRYAVATGQVHLGPVDGHLGLNQAKLAAVFALLDSRKAVSTADWALAATIIDTSVAVRAKLLAEKAHSDRERITTQGHIQAQRELAAEDLKERQKIARMTDAIIRKLANGPLTRSKLRKLVCSAETRHRFEPAIAQAIERGAITMSQIHGQGESGQEFNLT